MSVRFMRVLGVRAGSPAVLAIVDGWRVRWDPGGWDCACPDPECPHVDEVADLLAPSVLNPNRTGVPND